MTVECLKNALALMHFPGSVITHYNTFIPMGCKV